MATIQSNRISAALFPADLAAVKGMFQSIYNLMPFLVGLSKDERITLLKINSSNKTFTEDAITAANNNAGILPAYFKPDEMQKDLDLFKALDELALLAAQLSEKISDTQMLAGSEAYVSALAVYRIFGSAATDGVPGADAAYALMKSRFAGQGNSGAATPPVTDPASGNGGGSTGNGTNP